MKVKDLIEKLSKLDPNLEVMTKNESDGWGVYYREYSGPEVVEAWKRSDMNDTYGPYKNEKESKKLLLIR
jgi:hypothetical protein